MASSPESSTSVWTVDVCEAGATSFLLRCSARAIRCGTERRGSRGERAGPSRVSTFRQELRQEKEGK